MREGEAVTAASNMLSKRERETAYLNTFPNTTTSTQPFSSVGAKVYYSSGTTTEYTATGTAYGIKASPGTSESIPVNAGYVEGTDTTIGFMMTGGISRRKEVLVFDNPSVFDLSVTRELEAQFKVGHIRSGVEHRLLISVGGLLYISVVNFINQIAVSSSDSVFPTTSETAVFKVDTKQTWYPVSLNVGTGDIAVTFTPVYTLPADAIISVLGFYVFSDLTSNKFRYDSFKVDVLPYVPEAAPDLTPVALMLDPVINNTATTAEVTYTARLLSPAPADTQIKFILTNAPEAEIIATILKGETQVSFSVIFQKLASAFEAMCKVLGVPYTVNVGTAKTATVAIPQTSTIPPPPAPTNIRIDTTAGTMDFDYIAGILDFSLYEYNIAGGPYITLTEKPITFDYDTDVAANSVLLRSKATDTRLPSATATNPVAIPARTVTGIIIPETIEEIPEGSLESFSTQITYSRGEAEVITSESVFNIVSKPAATVATFNGNVLAIDNNATSGDGGQLVIRADFGTFWTTKQLTVIDSTVPMATMEVVGAYLIDADNEKRLREIQEGDTINLAELSTRNLNIEFVTNPAKVGSLKIQATSLGKNVTESGAPYALFGDIKGDYNVGTVPTGAHVITLTPYSLSGSTGTAGTSKTINFSVTDVPVTQPSSLKFMLPEAYLRTQWATTGLPEWVADNKIPTFVYVPNVMSPSSPWIIEESTDPNDFTKGFTIREDRIEAWFKGDNGKRLPLSTSTGYCLLDLEDTSLYKYITLLRDNARGTLKFNFARDRFKAVMEAVRRLRPNAKFGWYDIPRRVYSQNQMNAHNGTTHDKFDEIIGAGHFTTTSCYPFLSDAQKYAGFNLDYLRLNMRELLKYKERLGVEVGVYMNERYHRDNTIANGYGYDPGIYAATGLKVSYRYLWPHYEYFEAAFNEMATYKSPDNGLSIDLSMWWSYSDTNSRKSRYWGEGAHLHVPKASDFTDPNNTDTLPDKVLLSQAEHDSQYFELITRSFGATGVSYL
ncbi:hypothetical protein I2I11_04240 [Pontibacter sp. 172403-2]|uniref:hypothetical protein n=1 Tax=Pontibacter rufus TaxID=2791028 RepID=UPI0018AF7B61|nr:hypothetical protein [Pontibacter sp. 172403-2]MBF9252494.1 hypothetical protein [Pontibacter sp. 172403-2]